MHRTRLKKKNKERSVSAWRQQAYRRGISTSEEDRAKQQAFRVRPQALLDGVAIVHNEIEAGAVLENSRALISQINVRLSAGELFVDVSSARELLFYLERAASALNSAPKDTNF
jgi:hypothetical protein